MDLTRRWAVVAFAQAGAEGGGAQWDLRDLYPSEAAWDAGREAVLAELPGLSRFKGRLGGSAQTLDAALAARSDLQRRVARLVTCASLSGDADVRASAGQERQAQAADLSAALDQAMLRAGGSGHPVTVIRRAGLDMTSPAPYQAIIKVFGDTLDQCDALLA